ncbi:HlyD family secretion protein [Sneathiella litorea]|uniref:HlyD family efflux transporter periplasmic adaptor subunit n=1 Tax=Sneathiella litorea TaxID=2606216 RepID=A0A6L8WCU1_9PROT|nr:HlyD family secretion protein [Sneathiella litorea]MZR32240.1 HlyD family efflux transporter periplasmic adaptor subunit [Sneathiella litorea]
MTKSVPEASDHPAKSAQENTEVPTDLSITSTSPKKSRRQHRWMRSFLLLLGPLVVILVGGYIYFTGGRFVETDNAYVKADKVMVAAEVSGLISAVSIKENQRVTKGDILFQINDHPYRIAMAEAKAGIANAQDKIASLKATYRQKLGELTLARTNITFAKKEYERQEKLIATSAVSRSKLDATRHDLDIAEQQIFVINQQLAQISAQLGGNPDIPIEEHALYQSALAAQERAALNLERTIVRAPFDGIASNTPQIGQQVIGNGAFSSPVMSLVADSNIWIEANFKETDLTHVMADQKVIIHVDTYPDLEWQGTVESVAQATGAEFSVIPPQNATGNWVKVVQRIPVRIKVMPKENDPPLRSGMSTTVEIDTEQIRPTPEIIKTALRWLGETTAAKADEAASLK